MSQWLQSAKATVSAGASVISFTDNKDFSSVRAGDVVMINGQIWQCASGTRPDSAGQSLVNLAAAWPYTGASNVNAFVFRTTHDLLQLTSDARKLTNITKALLAAQEDILKGTTPTINVPIGIDPATGDEEVIEVTPWQYVINVVNASLGNISAIGAMSQVQFEAIREQNKDKYAASAWVSFGNHEAGKQVNECKPGLYTSLTTPNTLLIGKAGGVGGSKTDHGVLCIAGVIFDLPLAYPIRLAQAPDGKTTYNKSTGVITNHATVAAAFNAQAADPVNIEVVINRVDMWGFEAFPQEVTPANPEIYPQGVFSGLFTSMNGIPTSDSARPVSYFGFLGKKAKKVDFFALSDAQKKKVLADPKNNLYYSDDGRLIQWVLRGREFAGAGNGDWLQINSLGVDGLFANQSNARFLAQGVYEVSSSIGNDGIGIGYLGFTHGHRTKNQDRGLFSGRHPSLSAIEGECYFLVGGTVKRLNQGAYHPSFNPSGTAAISRLGVNLYYWYENPSYFSGTPSCFVVGTVSAEGTRGGDIVSGAVLNGRPDKRYYDVIYADGDGGVCRDMRYSAYGVASVDFAEADQRVKNGTYRGFERLPITIAGVASPYLSGLVVDLAKYGDVSQIKQSHHTSTEGSTSPRYKICNARTGQTIDTTGWSVGLEDKVYLGVLSDVVAGDKILVLANTAKGQLLSASSIGGSFLQTDVIGNPVNILATPALANGWAGKWISQIPNGILDEFFLSKQCIVAGAVAISYTTNNGANWGVTGAAQNVSSTAIIYTNLSANQINILTYVASANQTEQANNAPIFSGLHGVGAVWVSNDNAPSYGSLFMQSLIGKVGTNRTVSPTGIYALPMQQYQIDGTTGLFYNNANYINQHAPITNLGFFANSPAVKVLNYNVNINQQAVPHYAYTELKHNGTNLGDDSKVTTVDNQSTKIDLNGNTVLVGTAKLKEPIGWIKNKV